MDSESEDDHWLDDGLIPMRPPPKPVFTSDDDALMSLSGAERERCRRVWEGFLDDEGLASVEISPVDGLMRVDFVTYTMRMLEGLGHHPITRDEVGSLLDRIGHPHQHAVTYEDLVRIMTLVKNDLKRSRAKEMQEEISAALAAVDSGFAGIDSLDAPHHPSMSPFTMNGTPQTAPLIPISPVTPALRGNVADTMPLSPPLTTPLTTPLDRFRDAGHRVIAHHPPPTSLLGTDCITTAMKLLRKQVAQKEEVHVPKHIRDMLAGYVYEGNREQIKTRYYKKWKRFTKIFAKPVQRRDKGTVLGSLKRIDGNNGLGSTARSMTPGPSPLGASSGDHEGMQLGSPEEQPLGGTSTNGLGPSYGSLWQSSCPSLAAAAEGEEGTEGAAGGAGEPLGAREKGAVQRRAPWRVGVGSHHAASIHHALLENASKAHKELLYKVALSSATREAKTDAYTAVNGLLKEGVAKFQELGALLQKATDETMAEGVHMFQPVKLPSQPGTNGRSHPKVPIEREYAYTQAHLDHSAERLRKVCDANSKLLAEVRLAQNRNAARGRAGVSPRTPKFHRPHGSCASARGASPADISNGFGGSYPRAFRAMKPTASGTSGGPASASGSGSSGKEPLTPRQPAAKPKASQVRGYMLLRGNR